LEITADTLVADIAAHHPRSIEVFERHRIDFCCGGRRALGEACRQHGAAVDAVAAEIAAAAARERPEDRVFTDAPLMPHLTTEEERVFPAVRRLAEPGSAVEDVESALHALEQEHDRAGSALARLRALSGGFAVPEDGCTTYRALYEGLARFERELHEHVHLENNVLFPRVVSLQARAEGRGGPTGSAR